MVAYELNHNVNSEQRKHDAYDEWGRTYEYKVSSDPRWTFQDITQNVLDGYLDDEKIVLQGIQKVCEKEDCGFLVKGAFVDPLKALDALPELRPHLIITDVRMPQMDGLEFARRAKEILPESEIVILSGYRDFSYAQTAMQIGVSDYLLKPIKKTDFGDMLHRMYERLEAKIGQAAYYQVLDGYARGLVGEEEVKHVVSSVQPVNVAQRPGVLAKEGEQSPTKIVRDALYYIRRHYNENISLTDVAEHINVNKSYLCDVFKKEQKVTILQYMTNLRIEKAKELLLHTDMKMYEISVEVGYNDYTYFSQIFKRNTGSTLSEFRKKYARK